MKNVMTLLKRVLGRITYQLLSRQALIDAAAEETEAVRKQGGRDGQ